MFEFQVQLDSLDNVPQEFRALYGATEVDGKPTFKLNEALAKKLDVSGLSSALDKERKANKANGETLKSWHKLGLGETFESASEKLRELNERATNGDGKANWDKMKKDLEDGHLKVLGTKDAEVATMRKTVERYLVDNEAIAAITESKGSSALLLPHVRSQVKVFEEKGEYVVRVVDKDGDPRGDGRGGFMSIKDLVTEMRSSNEFGRAFEATGQSGSGKPPASSKTGKEASGGAGRESMSPTEKIAAGLRQKQQYR